MSIDPVAIYAAVVATGALAWEIHSRRYDRKGRLDIGVHASYASESQATLMVTIFNSNDFPVRIGQLTFTTRPADGNFRPGVQSISFNAFVAEVPTVVPAHDSVQFLWGQRHLETYVPGLVFQPGWKITVQVSTSLAGSFARSVSIVDISDKLADDMKRALAQRNKESQPEVGSE